MFRIGLILLFARLARWFADTFGISARRRIKMLEIQRRPYIKRFGLLGDVKLGFDVESYGCMDGCMSLLVFLKASLETKAHFHQQDC
jgi:hypothetical protein